MNDDFAVVTDVWGDNHIFDGKDFVARAFSFYFERGGNVRNLMRIYKNGQFRTI